MDPSSGVSTPGGLAWELLYQVLRASKPYLDTVSAAFDLTPQQMFAIKALSEEQMTMSTFASTLGCDASNVTALVDRLESRGLVERKASGSDRRVKVLTMTEAGVALQHRISARMADPPPVIANLSRADHETIIALFRRALGSLQRVEHAEANVAP